MRIFKIGTILLLAVAFTASCQRDRIIPKDASREVHTSALIPSGLDELPVVILATPEQTPIDSKLDWVTNSTIKITVKKDGKESTVYQADGLKIKGRGNSTWEGGKTSYPKKPYTLKLKEKADFLGTGKTSRWVLLAGWMDRTLLRNDVAFEMARRTSMEWAPSGTFVTLYLNDQYLGIYWLGEKIHVEGSHFNADYLLSFDFSDSNEVDFVSSKGYSASKNQVGGIPVEVKYPDRDAFTAVEFSQVVDAAQEALYDIEYAMYHAQTALDRIDMDSFCDYYLLYEICGNVEPRHPKSSFFYIRNGRMYAGPVWDFDWGTFVPNRHNLMIQNAVYYHQLMPQPDFKEHLKNRWAVLKPQFESIGDYIDARANLIRKEEPLNHAKWPCYPNDLAESDTKMVNGDEQMSFDGAVERMKEAIQQRISDLDPQIRGL